MVSVHGGHTAHSAEGDQESKEVATNKIRSGSSNSSSVRRGMVNVTKVKGAGELASKKHALSERKRRKRINCHYDSLRQFFPRILKSDKASVLAETVRRLKELKKMVADVAPPHDDDGERCASNRSRRSFFIPGENDEMIVSYVAGQNKTAVRAVVCCEDRPDLNQDLTDAIHSVGGKAVKAEMATIGGRTKAELVVEWPECGSDREEDVGLLRRALKAVVENRVLGRPGLYTDPDLVGFGPRFVGGDGLADGWLIVRS